MKRYYFTIVFLAVCVPSLWAQQNDLTFNGNGFVTGTTFFDGINEIEDPADILYEESTGKLIMVNQFAGDGSTLHRFNSDGTADTGFGTDGVQEYPFLHDEYFINIFQNGDGYRLTGRNSAAYNTYSPFLKEINADGSVNSSFGEEGIHAIYEIDSFIVKASCKGNTCRYYLAGYDVDWGLPAAVVAFNADGSFDTGFGYRTIDGFTYSYLRSILELPDGRILAAGEVQSPTSIYSYAMIVCLNADGSIDGSFGTDGFLFPEPDFEHNQFVIEDIVLSADGNIYAAGFVAYPSASGAKEMIIKFNNNGELLSDFGEGGYYFIEDIVANYPIQLVTDASDNLYLMEVYHPIDDATSQTIIHKIMPNGVPDLSFTNGVPGEFLIQIPGIESYYEIIGKQMIIQPDGKLVVVGITDGLSANDDFWIGRFTTNDSPVAIAESEIAEKSGVIVYPNPAEENIYFDTEHPIERIDIFSIDGKLIRSLSPEASVNGISLHDLSNGLYTAALLLTDGSYTAVHFVKE